MAKGTDSDYAPGWDSVEPKARVYYERAEDLDFAIVVAKEMCAEWDYSEDPHGYCHTRSVIQRLVRAVEAAR